MGIKKDLDIRIPDHIASIRAYDPGKIIAQLKEEYGWDKVSILWNNENTLGYSEKSKKAVLEAYDGINYYPDPLSLQLRNQLAQKHNKQLNEIVVGNGSESLIMLAIRAICSGEDEFLTSEGSFMIVYNWCKINNIRCVTTPLTEKYSFDLEAIKNRINRNTKVIYLANANNPTGTMISKKDLEQFIQHIPDHILIIVDEAYYEFSESLSTEFPNSMNMEYPNILSLRTLSKAYGIAGARLGYGVAHPKIVRAMMKSQLTFEPSSLAQAAGLGALKDTHFVTQTLKNNQQGINFFYDQFQALSINYIPSFANFVMTVWDSAEQVMKIFETLRSKGVLVRPLPPPLNHCIRISVGRPDENQHLIETLKEMQ